MLTTGKKRIIDGRRPLALFNITCKSSSRGNVANPKSSKDTHSFLGYALLFFLTPTTLFAQLTNPPKDATELLNRISIFIIDPILFTLFTAAFVVFVWGLVQFVAHLDNEEARSTGGKHMIWGIIGMVVMVGVNSIIAIIQNTIAQIGG